MNVLIISVHPDDETLGCGGAILRHRAAGDTVSWLVATVTHEPQWKKETIETKAAEVQAVAQAYGFREVFKLGLPTVKVDTIGQSELIFAVRGVLEKVRPQVVYLIHGGDIHTDHFAIFTATMSVLKPFYMRAQGVERVLCYETLSSTEAAPPLLHRQFLPNVFQDITPFIEQKIAIMNLYATELHADPMPRGPGAIRALARYRGATISVDYAEAFMLIREVT
jgi:LmbE family N-acetylglucosaminyl deacetylase